MSAETIARALGGASKTASGWLCKCPAHDDGTASLSLDENDSRLLWHCYAGCSQAAVGDALKAKGLMPERPKRAPAPRAKRKIVATYPYADAAGDLVLEVVRYEPKGFGQRRPDPDKPGNWIWSLKGIGLRPLYRLPELLAADPAEPVYVVEGEKDADRLRSIGLIATTSSQGAGSWKHTDPGPLAGRHIVLVPDHDPQGQGYVAEVARGLKSKAASLRLLELSGLDAKQDASDWLDRGGTADELRQLAADALHYDPPPAEENEPPRRAKAAERPADAEDIDAGYDRWNEQLHRNNQGEARDIIHNVTLILRIDGRFKGRLRWNEMAEVVEVLQAPWRKGGWRPWTDADDIHLAQWCQQRHCYVRRPTCAQAVQIAARDICHHPVRDRLNSLSWDGVSRLSTWLTDYFGVADTEYTRAVGRAWAVSAVARVFKSGCKADHCLILEGPQGAGKSAAAAILALEDAWFSDELADLGTKDAAQDLRGKWIVELGELSALNRGAVERVKAFMSRRVDHYRPSYGTRSQDFPRQCVFIGSTNADAYLGDETGGRRFWPVKVGTIDIAKLKADREQLWAEAVAQFRAGAIWWLDKAAENGARKIQADRRIIDPWEEPVIDWAEAQAGRIAIRNVMTTVLGIPYDRRDQQAQNRVARIFKANGWDRKRDTAAGRSWRYERPTGTDLPAHDQTENSRVASASVAASMRSVPVSSHNVPVCEAPTGTEKVSNSAARPSVPVCPSKFQTHAETRPTVTLNEGTHIGEMPNFTLKEKTGTNWDTGTDAPAWDDLSHWRQVVDRTEGYPTQRRAVAKEWAIAAGATFDGYGMAVLPADLPDSLAARDMRLLLRNTRLMTKSAFSGIDVNDARPQRRF